MTYRQSLVLVLLLSACRTAQAPRINDMVGFYQVCPYHCMTVHLDSDQTFEVNYSGDLYNNETIKGRWKLSDDGFLIANGYEQPTLGLVTEETIVFSEVITVDVESSADPVPGAKVVIICESGEFQESANIEGRVQFVKCVLKSLKVMFDGMLRASYDVENSESNYLLVTIDLSVHHYITNAIWQVRGDKFFYFNTGTFGKLKRSAALNRVPEELGARRFRESEGALIIADPDDS